jgi:hypothetical protein
VTALKFQAIPADTTPEAEAVQLDVYRRMTPEKKLQLIFQMNDQLRELLAAGVRLRHPDYGDKHVKLAVIRLWLGAELFSRAYPGQHIDP